MVLEGLPGAGKTTLAARLAETLQAALVPEWVGFTDAQWARWPLHQPFYFANDELKETLARLVATPWVVVDRHYASTLVYAWALDGEGQPNPRADESWAGNLRWWREARDAGRLSSPEVTVWLDVAPERSLQRQPRARAFDPLWGDVGRLSAMRRGYAHFFSEIEPQVRLVKVDAEQPPEVVLTRVLEALA